MGATDPRGAAPGTLRAEFGADKQSNAVHGSDGPRHGPGGDGVLGRKARLEA